ncbi:AAC(3) family N-acetyltransferase [Paenibacillus pasadenensis]|uniref:aminoglycoside N(3)-acetyltransferase n=1 Tax=Paenibacillus pasadenensis TaxID=217090 RepID=UPI00203FE8F5|nr:AAC(3) family N-acetyltransferase [Paenibacillus pasadenensis]MCM3749208.1 AAC(3) family N-acetyltransferase [Paenibacillus pasadenensis]
MNMYEHERPLTRSDIVEGLTKLGVKRGMTLLVHASLKSFNRWIPGKSQAVVEALEEAIGPEGTLVMPTHTADLSEPSYWSRPPVPEAWWPIIRAEMTPFRPDLTETRMMGAIANCFFRQEGAMRSNHPQVSFAARGPLAEAVIGDHSLDHGLGERSPLARIYEHDGYVLLLGVNHDRNTSLHLAEERSSWPGKKAVRQGSPMLVDGTARWVEFEDLAYDDSDFIEIGEAFENSHPLVRLGLIGDCQARLLPQRALIDFAVQRMAERKEESPQG